jgi:carboxylesterase type B
VKRNAKAFGGDPSDITLIGKPADDPHTGIRAQLASPGSAYLFEHVSSSTPSCGASPVTTGLPPP